MAGTALIFLYLLWVAKLVEADEQGITQAAKIIGAGGVVAFPTETVYGLGANAFDAKAVAKIFAAKQRPQFDPLVVHIADSSEVERVAHAEDDLTGKLIDHFWPGPLTLILHKVDAIPALVTAGLDTVAVRVPSHGVARDLIAQSGVPLAAPSANKFGLLSPTRAEHVIADLGDQIDMVLDDGPTTWGVESTIVQVLDNRATILRLGATTVEAIEAVIGPVEVSRHTGVENVPQVGPGQLTKHYSPNTKLRMIQRGELVETTDRIVYLAFASPPPDETVMTEILSEAGDLEEAAARLFDVLHQIDDMDVDMIVAEWLPEQGLGRAINDRLRRAAARWT